MTAKTCTWCRGKGWVKDPYIVHSDKCPYCNGTDTKPEPTKDTPND